MLITMSKITTSSTILVGTYRKDQLQKWILPKGLYDELDALGYRYFSTSKRS